MTQKQLRAIARKVLADFLKSKTTEPQAPARVEKALQVLQAPDRDDE